MIEFIYNTYKCITSTTCMRHIQSSLKGGMNCSGEIPIWWSIAYQIKYIWKIKKFHWKRKLTVFLSNICMYYMMAVYQVWVTHTVCSTEFLQLGAIKHIEFSKLHTHSDGRVVFQMYSSHLTCYVFSSCKYWSFNTLDYLRLSDSLQQDEWHMNLNDSVITHSYSQLHFYLYHDFLVELTCIAIFVLASSLTDCIILLFITIVHLLAVTRISVINSVRNGIKNSWKKSLTGTYEIEIPGSVFLNPFIPKWCCMGLLGLAELHLDLHVLGLWEETRLPGENGHRCVQAPCEIRPQSNPGPSSFWNSPIVGWINILLYSILAVTVTLQEI